MGQGGAGLKLLDFNAIRESFKFKKQNSKPKEPDVMKEKVDIEYSFEWLDGEIEGKGMEIETFLDCIVRGGTDRTQLRISDYQHSDIDALNRAYAAGKLHPILLGELA